MITMGKMAMTRGTLIAAPAVIMKSVDTQKYRKIGCGKQTVALNVGRN
jgi:hypothetical protein